MGNSRVACRCVEKPTATTTTDAAYLPAETLTEHYEPWGASIAADILPVPLPTLPNALPSINTPQNRFTYNGKELQTDIGLFEYGFRWYDPMNARFTSVDPLANDYAYKTPYDYAENKPVIAVDLDGLEAFFVHGTQSNNKRWLDKSNNLNEGTKALFRLSNNRTFDASFNWGGKLTNWGNGVFNTESDRNDAAKNLATHIRATMTGNEDITMIGHSHGGNVSIQAIPILRQMLDDEGFENIKINIITISTPADNHFGSPENPDTYGAELNKHIHIYNEIDGVQTGGANIMDFLNISSFLPKEFRRVYNNDKTINYRIDVDSQYSHEYQFPKSTVLDKMRAHSADVESDLIKKKIEDGTIKR
ncbi:hypothetical protein EMA8858_00345 [Emticicia aquatica]|uniref:RHS repeat-associated core domain-containing protein n=1 Tax=Emticicia aquatica TaxID=1681835 RepID=A0ABN8EQQ5_9BACT|nr:RHS repeat-associated core domain-containing protein [Emticicia aquatica]CAH0994236.1 hypothetical protein EMA8858_00345 [Emticicia aquatica]